MKSFEFNNDGHSPSLLNSNQCYFKAAINFFLNCGQFISQFYSKNSLEEQDLNQESPNLCQTDSLTGGTNIIYILFNKMFNENEKNNDIDDYYLQLKDIVNVNLNNKYQFGFPGYKIYSFYVIQVCYAKGITNLKELKTPLGVFNSFKIF